MLRFGKTKLIKEAFYGIKMSVTIWDVNVDNIVISKLVGTKNKSKHLFGYSDEIIRPLVLLLPIMSRYVKAFEDKSRNKNNKLMPLRVNDNKLLEKYKTS